jgi:hypothetical protein
MQRASGLESHTWEQLVSISAAVDIVTMELLLGLQWPCRAVLESLLMGFTMRATRIGSADGKEGIGVRPWLLGVNACALRVLRADCTLPPDTSSESPCKVHNS